MTKKSWTLLFALVALGAWYVVGFTDAFARPRIQLNVSSRPARAALESDEALPLVVGLDRDYGLTSVRVAPLDAQNTNRLGAPIWHLVATKPSPPTRGFLFGETIDGLKPAPDVKQPGKLVVGQSYRLEVEAGRLQGSVDFVAK